MLLLAQAERINGSDNIYSLQLDGLWKLNIESENNYKDKNYSPIYLRFLTNKNNNKYAIILNSVYADFIATDLNVNCSKSHICTIKNSKNSEILRLMIKNPKAIEIKYSLSDGENSLIELVSGWMMMFENYTEMWCL